MNWRIYIIADVRVVSTEAVDPTDHENVAGPEHVEQTPALGTLGERDGNARHAFVGHDLIDFEPGLSGVRILVHDVLISAAHARIQNRFHPIPGNPS